MTDRELSGDQRDHGQRGAHQVAAGWLCERNLGSGFMPSMDEGGFIIDYVTPAGASIVSVPST